MAHARRTNGKFKPIWGRSWRFYLLLTFTLLCAAGGGVNRADALSLLYLRPCAIIILAVLALSRGSWDFRPVRVPIIILGLFAATMAIQLIPLPPALWSALPGHGQFAKIDAIMGISSPWRPISLAPDLTANGLLALLPPLVALIAFAGIPMNERYLQIPILMALMIVSALLGVAQILQGPQSPLYYYEFTSRDLPVGLFANRNQQAVFLALLFPLCGASLVHGRSLVTNPFVRYGSALAAILIATSIILLTGSRTGLVAMALGLTAGVLILWNARTTGIFSRTRWLTIMLVAAPIVIIGIAGVFANTLGLGRIENLAVDISTEQRLQAWPVVWRMILEFFPFGSGYGSFEKLFQHYEPDGMLRPFIFNHAHNELLETALTAGVFGVSVVFVFLTWFARKIVIAFQVDRSIKDRSIFIAASAGIIIILGASISEYPLRSPLFALVFALLCSLMSFCSIQRSES